MLADIPMSLAVQSLRTIANLRAYNAIWRYLRSEPGYQLRFGNLEIPAVRAWPWDWVGIGRWWKFLVVLDGLNIGVGVIILERENAVCSIEVGLLPQYRSQGLGGRAGRLLISKCFTDFEARRVESTALSTNPASIKMRDWMIYEGTLKARYLIDGQEIDELIYAITRSEWEGRSRGTV